MNLEKRNAELDKTFDIFDRYAKEIYNKTLTSEQTEDIRNGLIDEIKSRLNTHHLKPAKKLEYEHNLMQFVTYNFDLHQTNLNMKLEKRNAIHENTMNSIDKYKDRRAKMVDVCEESGGGCEDEKKQLEIVEFLNKDTIFMADESWEKTTPDIPSIVFQMQKIPPPQTIRILVSIFSHGNIPIKKLNKLDEYETFLKNSIRDITDNVIPLIEIPENIDLHFISSLSCPISYIYSCTNDTGADVIELIYKWNIPSLRDELFKPEIFKTEIQPLIRQDYTCERILKYKTKDNPLILETPNFPAVFTQTDIESKKSPLRKLPINSKILNK